MGNITGKVVAHKKKNRSNFATLGREKKEKNAT